MTDRPRWRGLALTALLGALVASGPGRAEGPPQPDLCRIGGQPATIYDLRPLFGDSFDRLVTNGMTHTLVARINIREAAGSKKVLATGIRVMRLRYYLWEEYFMVEISDPTDRSVKKVRDLPSLRGLLSDIGPLKLLTDKPLDPHRKVVAELILDLDPMSQEQLKQLHRLLANPRARGAVPASGGSSLFGTMAGLFVDRSKFRSRRRLEFIADAPRQVDQLPPCPATPNAQ